MSHFIKTAASACVHFDGKVYPFRYLYPDITL